MFLVSFWGTWRNCDKTFTSLDDPTSDGLWKAYINEPSQTYTKPNLDFFLLVLWGFFFISSLITAFKHSFGYFIFLCSFSFSVVVCLEWECGNAWFVKQATDWNSKGQSHCPPNLRPSTTGLAMALGSTRKGLQRDVTSPLKRVQQRTRYLQL